jgi:hypothetical protein
MSNITIENIKTNLKSELSDILKDIKKKNGDLICSGIISELLETLVYEGTTLEELIQQCIDTEFKAWKPEIL